MSPQTGSRTRAARHARVLLAAVLVALTARPAGASGHLPPGSYLRAPVNNVAALKRQVRRDPVVSARYMKLFQKKRPADVMSLFSGLRVRPMPKDRILRVYYTRPGGRQGYKLRRVRRGTIVFSLADGSPLLIRVCGNPVRTDRRIEGLTEGEKAHHLAPDFDETEPVEAPNTLVNMLSEGDPSWTIPSGILTHEPISPRGFPIVFAPVVLSPMSPSLGGPPKVIAPTPTPTPAGGGGDTPAPPNPPVTPPNDNPPPIEPPVPPYAPPTPPIVPPIVPPYAPPTPPIVPPVVPPYRPPTPPFVPLGPPATTPEPGACAMAAALLAAWGCTRLRARSARRP